MNATHNPTDSATHRYQLTNYPDLFYHSHWGQQQLPDEAENLGFIVQNRNDFARRHKLVSADERPLFRLSDLRNQANRYLPPKCVPEYVDFFAHQEAYRTRNDQILIVLSPDKDLQIPHLLLPLNFRMTPQLYGAGWKSYCALFESEQAFQERLMQVAALLFQSCYGEGLCVRECPLQEALRAVCYDGTRYCVKTAGEWCTTSARAAEKTLRERFSVSRKAALGLMDCMTYVPLPAL